MNKQFMVECAVPVELTEEFVRRIPAQQAMVKRLLVDGTLASYSLTLDRSKLYMILNVRDTASVYETIGRMPLGSYLEPTLINELMFHNTAAAVMHFSLN
jgi:hypothetical protein